MASILGSLVGSCAKKLQDIITEEAVMILGVKKDLGELKRKLERIQCFLKDAERRRTEEPTVNSWLGELKDAVYDGDDIVDLARSEGRKLLADYPTCSGTSFFLCIPNTHSRHKIAVRIKKLDARLEGISKEADQILKFWNVLPEVEARRSSSIFGYEKKKSSDLVEPNLVGEETLNACTRLAELVLAHNGKRAYKLGIVGTGGVGKTTLAQKIYNYHKIKGTFSKRAWICVSREYSEVALLKEVLRNFGEHLEQGETVGELESKLAATVSGLNFFLVLDDVWQHEVWTNLLRVPLSAASTGVILVTTRDDKVARGIVVEHMHRVELMPADIGWELLWKSMNISEEKEVENLRDIGLEIVHKCCGLPLAIKVIASVLATYEQTENQWRKVIDKTSWNMSKLPPELGGALYLSYDELPSYLKQCFLYCALYPEDWYMYRDDLIRFWVAEGFVEEQQELLENRAEEYYYELINRNLLQPDPGLFDHSRCKMHDLLRELAQYLSGQEYFFGDPHPLEIETLSKLRRVTVFTDKDVVVLPGVEKDPIKVRTLNFRRGKAQEIKNSIFKRLPHIRVLDLSGLLIQSIPDCIGFLIHLRSLDLDETDISYLPESISSLINLQVLNLQRCVALHSLPRAITQLCNLRRLGLAGTPIKQVPKGVCKLKFLNDLEGFPIGCKSIGIETQDGWNLEELGQLPQLRHLAAIILESAVPCATDSLLKDKGYLKLLCLTCTNPTNEPYLEEHVSNIGKIFEQLTPPRSLENLLIYGFFGRTYPTWLGDNHLCSIKILNLINCESCVHLPSIGQLPNLSYLKISGATAVTKIGPDFVGCGSTEAAVFSKLEVLVMENMLNLEEWSFVEEEHKEPKSTKEDGNGGSDVKQKGKATSPILLQLLPRLKRLHLLGCPKLRDFPQQLTQGAILKEVMLLGPSSIKVVENIPFLSGSLVIGAFEDLERVSNLPQLREMRLTVCPNLRHVKDLGSLRQLWLAEDMLERPPRWVFGLKQILGPDLDVYKWSRDMP